MNGAPRRFVFARSARPSAIWRPAAATTKADGAARRRPRTRPAGDAKPAPPPVETRKRSAPALDLQDTLTQMCPDARDCPRINTNFTNMNQIRAIREDSWTARRGLVPGLLLSRAESASFRASPPCACDSARFRRRKLISIRGGRTAGTRLCRRRWTLCCSAGARTRSPTHR